MTRNSSLDGSVEVVCAVGQEDERALSILCSIDTVHHVEHVDETASIASLHEVPVALALEVDLGSIHNLHAVDVHLATTLHLQRQRARLALVVEDSRTAVAIRLALNGSQRLAVLLHSDAGGRAILAERHSDSGLRANEQVDGVAVLEGPSVLCIVPVEAVASRIECLVILGIEELVGEVEGVLLVGAGLLNLGLDGIELGVAGNDVGGGELLAQDRRLEPTTSLVAFLRGSHFSNVAGELANGGILLHGLRLQHGGAVDTYILQRAERLVDHIQHIVHLRISSRQGDGDLTLALSAFVGQLAYFTAGSSNVGQRILGAHHRLAILQLESSLIQFAEHILSSIFSAVDLERGQDGHFLLSTTQRTFDDNVGKTHLLPILQVIEEELQTTCAFTRCSTSDVVVFLSDQT